MLYYNVYSKQKSNKKVLKTSPPERTNFDRLHIAKLLERGTSIKF